MVRRPVIIDTNLLVLLTVGTSSRSFIGRHKRTRAFTEADFEHLLALLSSKDTLILMPNTLAEASNLLRQFAEPGLTQVMETYGTIVARNVEVYVRSARAVARPEFRYLGLTDAALLEIRPRNAPLITADFDLYRASLLTGRPTTNFSHERESWLDV